MLQSKKKKKRKTWKQTDKTNISFLDPKDIEMGQSADQDLSNKINK